MDHPIDYEKDGHVVTVRLNDPDRRNGLSPEMVEGLLAAMARLRAERDVRCAILTGEGSAFSAGGDPRRMLQPGLYPDMSTVELHEFYQRGIQRLPLAFAELDIPLIAAVNGAAIGAGCDLCCMCDIRIAAENAVFASSFVRLGLVPGDGGAWLLPRVAGLANGLEMILTGETIDATRAREIGLVSAVADTDSLLAEARQRAERIAANPPRATQLAKRLVNESQGVGLQTALQLAAAMQSMLHKTDDHREAVSAALEKRTPTFKGN